MLFRSGTEDTKKLYLWNPIPQKGGYTCPGQVAKTDNDEPPAVEEVACVLEAYLKETYGLDLDYVWNDSGSGADMDGSVWKCPEGNEKKTLDPSLFVSRRVSDDPGINDCRVLKKFKFAECKDDPAFRFRDKENWDCAWVGENVQERCKKKWKTSGRKKVFDHCPVTCGKC